MKTKAARLHNKAVSKLQDVEKGDCEPKSLMVFEARRSSDGNFLSRLQKGS